MDIRSTSKLPAAPAGPQSDAAEIARAERHYTRLRARVARWLEGHRMGGLRGEMVLLLPDLFMLLIRLLRDARIDGTLKAQLLTVSAYVISPIDLVPDFLLPVGLTDDTVAVAYVLTRVVAMLGLAGEDILRQHWDGRGDVLDQIRRIVALADRALNSWLLGWLNNRFGAPRRAKK